MGHTLKNIFAGVSFASNIDEPRAQHRKLLSGFNKFVLKTSATLIIKTRTASTSKYSNFQTKKPTKTRMNYPPTRLQEKNNIIKDNKKL